MVWRWVRHLLGTMGSVPKCYCGYRLEMLKNAAHNGRRSAVQSRVHGEACASADERTSDVDGRVDGPRRGASAK